LFRASLTKLAENTQQITSQPPNPPLNQSQTSLQVTTPTKSVESLLLENNQVETQIQSLAKVIKTEDNLIAQLFEDWA